MTRTANVLVIEDDANKRDKVVSVLRNVDAPNGLSIDCAGDVVTARSMLSRRTYDLVVVDIVLPTRSGGTLVSDAGVRLIQAIYAGETHVQHHIVGLTAVPEAFDAAREMLSSRALTVLQYDGAEDGWSQELQARLRHILDSAQVVADQPYRTDLGVVCALREPELDALKRIPWRWKQAPALSDHAIYWEATASRAEGELSIAAVAAPRMGLSAAAVATSKLIERYRPRYVAMIGICAGTQGKTRLGDVVVANPVWDYGSGKWIKGDKPSSKIRLLPDPHQLDLNVDIRTSFNTISDDDSLLLAMRRAWPASGPTGPPKVLVGPMASGAAVLADGVTIRELTDQQNRKLLAVDMEAYAVHLAAEECSRPRPIPFVIKAVVDHADVDKGDDTQSYGAHVSAQVLRAFVENHMPITFANR